MHLSVAGMHDVTSRIHDVTPRMHGVNPWIHDVTPWMHDVTTWMHDVTPWMRDVTPCMHDVIPRMHDVTQWMNNVAALENCPWSLLSLPGLTSFRPFHPIHRRLRPSTTGWNCYFKPEATGLKVNEDRGHVSTIIEEIPIYFQYEHVGLIKTWHSLRGGK